MKKLQDILHKRILLVTNINRYSKEGLIGEFLILEISPSENWVKVQNDIGKKYWMPSKDIVPVEVLTHLEKSPSK